MYCPSCKVEMPESGNGMCQACGFTAGQANNQAPVHVRAVRARQPVTVILGLGVDRTGSSQEFARGIPMIAERVLRNVEAIVRDLRVSVWTHGDLELNEQPIQMIENGTPEQAIGEVNRIVYGGGGDAPETHADQIEHLLEVLPWGSGQAQCRNALVMFLTDETKPLRSGKSMQQLGQATKDKRVKLFLVCQETPNLRELVNAAGGFLIPITNTPDDAEIQGIVSRLTASITATVASGGTIPMSAAQQKL